MSERKWHAVGSSDFRPGIWRWQRGEVLVMIAALGLGLVVFRLLDWVGFPIALSLSAAAPIPMGAAAFLLCLVTGKPRNHAVDAIEWLWIRLAGWLANHGVPVNSKPLIEIPEHERKF